MVVTARVSTRWRSKSFAMPVVNGWNKPPEERFEMGSVCGFKGMLDNARMSLFWEHFVWSAWLRSMAEGNARQQFSL